MEKVKPKTVNITPERWNGLTLLAEKHDPKLSNATMLDFILKQAGVKNLTDEQLHSLLSKVEVVNF